MTNVIEFTLERAEAEIARRLPSLNKQWYPKFHIAGRTGWINDPNGLIYVDGWYHAFYQFHPYSTAWGPMHWGHARSRDMLHWEQLPVALAPDTPSDIHGCFSGSAVVMDDGRLALIYTGNVFEEGKPHTDDNLYQVQCLAIATDSDNITFEKQGTIISTPEGVNHFRDPKVWKAEDGRWYMVVGAKVNDKGEIQLYSSDSQLKEWTFEGPLLESDPADGAFMWECPDFFKLDDKYVLLFSPQGLKQNGYDNVNLYQSGYIIGTWEPGKPFVPETPFIEIDKGDSFYAPQTFVAPDGRRVLMGWMVMWDSYLPESRDGWAGQLTIPRELTLNNDKNRIVQKPITEMYSQVKVIDKFKDCLKNESMLISGVGRSRDFYQIRVSRDDFAFEQAGISLGKGLSIYIDTQLNRLVLSRNYPEYGIVGHRSVPLPDYDVFYQVLIDSSSVEVFLDYGDAVMSSRYYPNVGDSHHAFVWGGKTQQSIISAFIDLS